MARRSPPASWPRSAATTGRSCWSSAYATRLRSSTALLAVADAVGPRIGTLPARREWYHPWRTVSGGRLADPQLPELQVLSDGVFAPRPFLDLVRDFIVFEDEGGGRLVKKMAGYHQF